MHTWHMHCCHLVFSQQPHQLLDYYLSHWQRVLMGIFFHRRPLVNQFSLSIAICEAQPISHSPPHFLCISDSPCILQFQIVDFSPQLYVCLDYPLGYINFGLWVVRFMNLSPNYESNAVGISICVALINQNKLETSVCHFRQHLCTQQH